MRTTGCTRGPPLPCWHSTYGTTARLSHFAVCSDDVISVIKLLNVTNGAWPLTQWAGKHVLELGCGTALCGLLCGVLGANVILTDRPRDLRLQSNISHAISINGLSGMLTLIIIASHTITFGDRTSVLCGIRVGRGDAAHAGTPASRPDCGRRLPL